MADSLRWLADELASAALELFAKIFW